MFVFVLWLPLLLFTFQDIPTALCCKQIDSFWSIPTCLHAPMSLHHCIHSTMYTTCSTYVLESRFEMQIPTVLWQYAFSGLYQIACKLAMWRKRNMQSPSCMQHAPTSSKCFPKLYATESANASTFQVKCRRALIQSGNARLCWTAGKKVYIFYIYVRCWNTSAPSCIWALVINMSGFVLPVQSWTFWKHYDH